MAFTVRQHRSITKSDRPKLEKTGLADTYDAILDQLAENPFAHEFSMEILEPRHKEPRVYSMRINSQHRAVYTIDKENKVVRVWSAWTHYEKTVRKIKR